MNKMSRDDSDNNPALPCEGPLLIREEPLDPRLIGRNLLDVNLLGVDYTVELQGNLWTSDYSKLKAAPNTKLRRIRFNRMKIYR